MLQNALKTLTQIFKYRDLRGRILLTVLILVIYRLVAHVPLPGVNIDNLTAYFSQNQFLGLVDLFSGGSISRFSIVMMGVAPYINASIIMQLMTMAVPSLEALNKEGDAGRRTIARYTRYLTVPLAFIQSYGMITLLRQSELPILTDVSTASILAIMLTVTAGTIFLMWLGELITEKGVGNGVSLIITISILSRIPASIGDTLAVFDNSRVIGLAIYLILTVLTIVFIIYLNEGVRNVPVSYARRIRGNRLVGGGGTNLPLKVNQAGVIPIIFALSMLLFPGLVSSLFANATTPWVAQSAAFVQKLFQNQNFYLLMYFVLVFVFTFFYVSVVFVPENVANNLQKQGGFIQGIRPGAATTNFLRFVSTRITFAGASFLAIIAVMPVVVQNFTGITTLSLDGIGLLIVVAVVLETLRQIQTQLLMKQYEVA